MLFRGHDRARGKVAMSCRDESFITGWSIYPLGYYYGYLMGAVVETLLNVVYNVADSSTRAFMLACWCAAKAGASTLSATSADTS